MYAIEDKHDAQIKELMDQDVAKTTKIEHLELQIQEQKVELNETRAKLNEQKLGKKLVCVLHSINNLFCLTHDNRLGFTSYQKN